MRKVNPDAYLLGEIWEAEPRWANDRHFDGLMNYPLRTAILGLLNKSLTASQFAEKVEKLLELYPHANAYAMLNGLGTHDTERILTLCEGDTHKVELANLFLFTYPGAPSIYYGDEVGLEGGKDPDNRRAFPWVSSQWNTRLRNSFAGWSACGTGGPACGGETTCAYSSTIRAAATAMPAFWEMRWCWSPSTQAPAPAACVSRWQN